MLENLEYELEAEKERLLALLHNQRDSDAAEKLKQLEMAKLRRQQRLLKRDGQLNEVSAMIHLAQKNEENRLSGSVFPGLQLWEQGSFVIEKLDLPTRSFWPSN